MSPYNEKPEVLALRNQPAEIIIHDATLRDGEQTPGVVFRKEDKVRIAKALDKVGVHRIEAGMPAVSRGDFEAIGEIVALGLKSKIFTFARAINENVDKALACGAHGVVVENPLAMFATHPALTGRKGKIVLGKKSGSPSVLYKLKELGL